MILILSLCIPGGIVPIDSPDCGMCISFLHVSSQLKVYQDSLGFHGRKDEVGSTSSTYMFGYGAFKLTWSGIFIGVCS